MRICVGDLTGSSEVIFQILGRKKERKINIGKTISKKQIYFLSWQKRRRVDTHLKKKYRVVNETKKRNKNKIKSLVRR